MAKTRVQKEQALQDLQNQLQTAKAVVFANFQGLKVKDSEELRGICRKQGLSYVASKKTLIKKSLASVGVSDIDVKSFEGGIAAVCASNDEMAPAQIVANFAKKFDVVTIFGGMFEGKFIDATKVKALSLLPSREALLGQLVGTLNAPISGFVNVLAGNIRGLVNVLSAIKDAKV